MCSPFRAELRCNRRRPRRRPSSQRPTAQRSIFTWPRVRRAIWPVTRSTAIAMAMASTGNRVSSDNGFAGTIATTLPETPGPGVASFTGLADGTYTVTTNVPENTSVFIYCTDANDAQVPGSFDDTTQSLTVALASGDAITCDWYELPGA